VALGHGVRRGDERAKQEVMIFHRLSGLYFQRAELVRKLWALHQIGAFALIQVLPGRLIQLTAAAVA
jgi:hypothetical protein